MAYCSSLHFIVVYNLGDTVTWLKAGIPTVVHYWFPREISSLPSFAQASRVISSHIFNFVVSVADQRFSTKMAAWWLSLKQTRAQLTNPYWYVKEVKWVNEILRGRIFYTGNGNILRFLIEKSPVFLRKISVNPSFWHLSSVVRD